MSIDQSFEDTYRRLADALTVTVLTGAGSQRIAAYRLFVDPTDCGIISAPKTWQPRRHLRVTHSSSGNGTTGAEVSLPLHDRMPLTMRWLDWNGDSINAGAASGSSRKMSTVCTCRPDRAG